LTLRATPDFTAIEGNTNQTQYLLYDCRAEEPQNAAEREIVRTGVELFHHILVQNGVQSPLKKIEYVHLGSGKVLRWTGSPRQRTLQRATNTANAINALWNSL
jgi:hypothetical protein